MKIKITLQQEAHADTVMQLFTIRKDLNKEDGITNATLNVETGIIICDVDEEDFTAARPKIDALCNWLRWTVIKSICAA